MPIDSRELKHIRPQRGDTVRVEEVLTSAKGQVIRHSYLAPSEAFAIADMNARDVVGQFENADFAELLIWVQAKNAPDGFDFTDRELTLFVGEKRLLVHFATSLGNKAMSLAWWIEDMKPPEYLAIRIRTGYDSDTGDRIDTRARAMFAAEPSFDAVERSP